MIIAIVCPTCKRTKVIKIKDFNVFEANVIELNCLCYKCASLYSDADCVVCIDTDIVYCKKCKKSYNLKKDKKSFLEKHEKVRDISRCCYFLCSSNE